MRNSCGGPPRIVAALGRCAFLALLAEVLALSAAAADVEVPVEVARGDDDTAKNVTIKSQTVTVKGRALTVVLKPLKEDFSLKFDFAEVGVQTVKIIIENGVPWKDIRYFPTTRMGNFFVDLKHVKGLSIEKSGSDCLLLFDQRAAKILPPRGLLKFSKAYQGPKKN